MFKLFSNQMVGQLIIICFARRHKQDISFMTPMKGKVTGRFGPESFRPGSFRPESIRPWVVSANFGESFRPDFI